MLNAEWDAAELIDWGMDIKGKEEKYTSKIDIPIYEPREVMPNVNFLCDVEKYESLIGKINESKVTEDEKKFLRLAAARHIVFNYESIGDYYAGAAEEMQVLMEESALVIIDFGRAIENGFVKMSSRLLEINERESHEE